MTNLQMEKKKRERERERERERVSYIKMFFVGERNNGTR
jgi:hypothetical protein